MLCMVAVLLAGVAMIGYARFSAPIVAGDRAAADGRWEDALASYGDAERRFDRLPALKQIAAADYARVVEAQLAILYTLRRYDDLIDRVDRSPDRASPHFWEGLALYAKGRAEEKPEPRLQWFTRAEDDFRRAVGAAPTDWDAKYDLELVSRLVNEVRKQPKTPPKQLMQLLHPESKTAARPAKRVG